LMSAVELFEQMMPDYLAELERQLAAGDQAGIVSEAHKIKSAVGAIGLRRLHQLAKQAQSPDLPDWTHQVAHWIAELRGYYPVDLQQLKQWLTS
jgi:two-component system, OmpR family, aerobic respiration control sensor histidine kinase ArcB